MLCDILFRTILTKSTDSTVTLLTAAMNSAGFTVNLLPYPFLHNINTIVCSPVILRNYPSSCHVTMHLHLGVHHVYINLIGNVWKVLRLAKTQPRNVDTILSTRALYCTAVQMPIKLI